MKLARMPDGSPEIFHTIQGEGRNVGLPTVFIRSSLCNLHCHWCDTPYTWNWDDTDFDSISGKKYAREEQIVTLSVPEIVDYVTSHFDCRNFVFTGGEPLLQQKEWIELMKQLQEASGDGSCHFEVETNGTLLPNAEFLSLVDQLNISPKLENSRVPEEQRIKREVLEFLADLPVADFKFVIGNESDFAEVLALAERVSISPRHLFLMPKANTLEELESSSPKVVELCKDHGFRFSDRLHLRLFGAKRGF